MATARGGGVAVQVRKEIAPLVSALLDATKAAGYKPIAGQCGGYACRSIRGSSRPSNHSWGLAVDLNWNRNPMGIPFRCEIPPGVVHLWEAAGFYWGGRYKVRPDTMHFEYVGTPRSVAGALAEARGASQVADAGSSPGLHEYEPGSRVISKGDKGNDVALVQRFLGVKPANGTFGDKTLAAVRKYQEMQGLVIDGVVGDHTWKPILSALGLGKKK